ncbi:hypothetical protein SAMN05216410_1387 [Sanguibacter gelidistatuariae]|uniref:Uncharacterized protein n=1 Tax=Sanguibacter gelidistatuariae TaxID=1814289 RepID=A0A1G6JPN3_9MICO|nr:hypothetical protein [Sanguibacter gelidistatuariae]SDC20722.1 hypothetical protein SAMN05216410_1387 [Sanguibacter gelidistatuariae]
MSAQRRVALPQVWQDRVRARAGSAAAGVLRPITASKRDMAWAAGDVLDEADVMVDRLRFG